MGICGAKMSPEEKLQRDKSRQIAQRLKGKGKKEDKFHKMLLLGAGESGKSTLFKQMINLYGPGVTKEQQLSHLPVVFNNMVITMQEVIEQCEDYSALESKEAKEAQEFFDNDGYPTDGNDTNDFELVRFDDIVKGHILALWNDVGFQKTYEQRAKYQLRLNDSLPYFINRLQEGALTAPDYIPTEADILRSRIKTTGIIQKELVIDDAHFRIFDVGGQRSERKKWEHCFEDVRAVIFVSAISEYDQYLIEDPEMNRMHESLNLFDQIVNSRWFNKSSIVLFLNKQDLFQEKIAKIPITVCFEDFGEDEDTEGKDPHSYEDVSQYIQDLCVCMAPDDREIKTHVTTATDKDNARIAFDAVRESIIKGALEQIDVV